MATTTRINFDTDSLNVKNIILVALMQIYNTFTQD